MTYESEFNQELEVAISIAKQAGNIILEYFDSDQQRQTKEDGTPVTIADKIINHMAIEEILKAFPDDGVVGEEESSSDTDRKRLWFCDPIDGTKPFTWGVPTAVFSLGLIIDNVPTLGVVYDPFLGHLFTGIAGHGSYCNDERLQVSSDGLDSGFIAVTTDMKRIVKSPPNYIINLVNSGAQIAGFSGGIYKSTLVARGRIAAYIEAKVAPHDIAAIHTIVTEAGGRVSSIDGRPLSYKEGFTSAIISNGIVHDKLVDLAA